MRDKACVIAWLTCAMMTALLAPANADPNDPVGRLDIHRVRGGWKAPVWPSSGSSRAGVSRTRPCAIRALATAPPTTDG
jgi:hypothetical protein